MKYLRIGKGIKDYNVIHNRIYGIETEVNCINKGLIAKVYIPSSGFIYLSYESVEEFLKDWYPIYPYNVDNN